MKYFIADLHLDHDAVRIGVRAEHFSTLEEWSDGMIEGINKTLGRSDTLYLLGDTCFKDQSWFRNKIKVRNVVCIIGNHEPSMQSLSNTYGRNNVFLTRDIKLFDGNRCWLSHYAHAFWPASHRGSYHLYGHTHGQREDTLDSWMPERRSMDVGAESIFSITGEWRPISEEEVVDTLSKRAGHDHIEFYQNLRGQYVGE